MILDYWRDYLFVFTNPLNILLFALATLLGLVAGAVPGMGASLTMTLLIPITFYLPNKLGLMMLIGAWGAATYGGSFSAILINTPGTSGNIATCLDGFPMARAGKAKVALGISATASMIGGLFGVSMLIFFSPVLARFTLKIQTPEYFLLAIFGIAMIATSQRKAGLKGLISAGIGLIVSFLGYDIITGVIRYNFGLTYLDDGIPDLVVMIGLFGCGQVLAFSSEKGSVAQAGKIAGRLMDGVRLVFKYWKTLLKSISIGTIVGFAPGVGISTAAILAHSEAASSSKHPETFGQGDPEGIVAAESANNAVQGGALIPALTLGIPGNSDSAVFLVGVMMYGIMPGKDLFQNNADLVRVVFGCLVLSQFAFALMGMGLTPIFSKITLIPIAILMPLVWLLASTGCYALHNNLGDVLAAIAIGIISFFMRKLKYPVIPMLMAVILGPIAEKNFLRALMLSSGSYRIFIAKPLDWILLAMVLFAFLFPTLRMLREKKARPEQIIG